jgi:chromosomal replication initiator protein
MKRADFKSHMDTIPKPDFIDEEKQESDKIQAIPKVDQQNREALEPDPEEVWKIVTEQLRMNISPRNMTIWYDNVYLESISNGVAILSCDNPVKREWIETNNKAFIRNKIAEVIGYKPELMINIRTTIQGTPEVQKEPEDESKYSYYTPSDSDQGQLFGDPSVSSTAAPKEEFQTNLNHKYLLSNFIVGNSNQLAYAVAENASKNPGTSYNPIFFYGPSGVGKTHLMQGIGNAILRQNPTAKVIYVPIETFMNEMIEAIRTNKNEDFRKKYRPADALIIDDIQFISTYTKTKEELFNTFNALYEANKQIVIASDRPPQEIDNLPDRLRTRFQGGMVVDIQSPDLETRIAILQQEANLNGAEIDPELIMFIAQNVENSVRELQGAMTKVITLTKINGGSPSVDSIAKMLQVDIDSKRKRVQPDDVIEAVGGVFDVTPKEITGKRRTAYVALARQVVMYLLRDELELPLEKVAQSVNRRDHTTVLHACDKIEKMLEEDERLNGKVQECREVFTV